LLANSSHGVCFVVFVVSRYKDCHYGLVVKGSWLQIQRSRVRFLALPDFLRIIEEILKK
jgi:hypothetical protein